MNKILNLHIMKTLYTLSFILFTGIAAAQVPTNFGSDAQDGITYSAYDLIDHGAVSSVRFMAQNAVAEGVAKWEFYTGDYMDNWRPWTADDTLNYLNVMINPAIETASARYNSNYGGGTGRLPAVQAGHYYTAIIGNAPAVDNFMSIIETEFDPVVIDTVYNTPVEPTEADDITLTVVLDGALTLAQTERVFIRASFNGWATSIFLQLGNFSNGVATVQVDAGTIPSGTTVEYYALVTYDNVTPAHTTIDYFTLYFGNNEGNNYSFDVSSLVGVEDPETEFGIIQNNEMITVEDLEGLSMINLISVDGKLISSQPVSSESGFGISTNDLPSGIYVLNLIGADINSSVKLFID